MQVKDLSNNFAKAGAVLVIMTAVVGVIPIVLLLVRSQFDLSMGIIATIVVFIPIFYFLGGYWLWKGRRRGIVTSLGLTGMAIVNVDTKSMYFSLSNGFSMNIEFDAFSIDVWSAFVMMILIWAVIRERSKRSSIEHRSVRAT